MALDQFSVSIARFVEKTKAMPAQVVRKVAIELLTNVVQRTPVGNPELWAVNKEAVAYNLDVASINAAIRSNPANLTKAGRLKPGRKVNDSMDIVKPAGYVGGRLRANWNLSIGSIDLDVSHPPDKTGAGTISRGSTTANTADATKPVYIMNSLPYIREIEYGAHSSQAPAGMVRITAAEFVSYVANAVAELPK